MNTQANQRQDYVDETTLVYCLVCQRYYPQTRLHWLFSEEAGRVFVSCRFAAQAVKVKQRIPVEDEVARPVYPPALAEVF